MKIYSFLLCSIRETIDFSTINQELPKNIRIPTLRSSIWTNQLMITIFYVFMKKKLILSLMKYKGWSILPPILLARILSYTASKLYRSSLLYKPLLLYHAPFCIILSLFHPLIQGREREAKRQGEKMLRLLPRFPFAQCARGACSPERLATLFPYLLDRDQKPSWISDILCMLMPHNVGFVPVFPAFICSASLLLINDSPL